MAKKREEIWVVTREYAGIAEAGGVKNVAQSLAEGLARLGKKVVVFIPKYGCVDELCLDMFSVEVPCAGKAHGVTFYETHSGTLDIILVDASIFAEKRAVYTYTAEDEKTIRGAVRGKGHIDTDEMNAVFELAVIAYAKATESRPSIVHCQDGHVALLPALAKEGSCYCGDARALFEETGFVTTIHNAGEGYRQVIYGLDRARELTGLSDAVLAKGLLGERIEPFLLAAEYGILSTVSPWYAEELVSEAGNVYTEGLSAEFVQRGVKIEGITNGIDFHRYDPSEPLRSYLPFPFRPWERDIAGKYRLRKMLFENIDLLDIGSVIRTGTLNADNTCVFFAYQGRIAQQKGIRVLIKAAKKLLSAVPYTRFLIMGQGDHEIEAELELFAAEYAGQVVFIRGYNKIVARRVICASDFVVLPSLYEPCGLEDYIAQVLGSIPVVHAVGGLQKIEHGKTGYLYHTEEGKPEEDSLFELLAELAEKAERPRAAAAAANWFYDNVPEPDEELIDVIAAGAQNVIKNCDWLKIIEEHYLPLYELSKFEVSKT